MEKEPNKKLDEEVEKLRESFKYIHTGIDALQFEVSLLNQAQKLGIPVADYRRLYELRDERRLPDSLQPEHWWSIPTVWIENLQQMPSGSKRLVLWSYVRKGALKAIQGGTLLALLASGGHYLLTTSQREKQAQDQKKLAHYQAWQMVFAAKGSSGEGGRIEALRDLAYDGTSLEGLDVSFVSLQDIDLSGLNLSRSNFKGATLWRVNLEGSDLLEANFQDTSLNKVSFRKAALWSANFQKASLISANLEGAYLCQAKFEKADLSSANLEGAFFCRAKFEKAKMSSENLSDVELLFKASGPLSSKTSGPLSGAHLCQTVLPDKTISNRDCTK